MRKLKLFPFWIYQIPILILPIPFFTHFAFTIRIFFRYQVIITCISFPFKLIVLPLPQCPLKLQPSWKRDPQSAWYTYFKPWSPSYLYAIFKDFRNYREKEKNSIKDPDLFLISSAQSSLSSTNKSTFFVGPGDITMWLKKVISKHPQDYFKQ